MSRSKRKGCRCRKGKGCKIEPPTNVKRNRKRDGYRCVLRGTRIDVIYIDDV